MGRQYICSTPRKLQDVGENNSYESLIMQIDLDLFDDSQTVSVVCVRAVAAAQLAFRPRQNNNTLLRLVASSKSKF